MKKVFCYNCLIEKNTPDLIEKLKKLGYVGPFSVRNGYIEKYIITHCDGTFQTDNSLPNENKIDLNEFLVDCGEDEDMFLNLVKKKKVMPEFKIKIKKKINYDFHFENEFVPVIRKRFCWLWSKIYALEDQDFSDDEIYDLVKFKAEGNAYDFKNNYMKMQQENNVLNIPMKSSNIIFSFFKKKYRIKPELILKSHISNDIHGTCIDYTIPPLFYPEVKRLLFWHRIKVNSSYEFRDNTQVHFNQLALAQDFIKKLTE